MNWKRLLLLYQLVLGPTLVILRQNNNFFHLQKIICGVMKSRLQELDSLTHAIVNFECEKV
jgi:hypothetical protein